MATHVCPMEMARIFATKAKVYCCVPRFHLRVAQLVTGEWTVVHRVRLGRFSPVFLIPHVELFPTREAACAVRDTMKLHYGGQHANYESPLERYLSVE
jgi:hypothetical protein